MEWLQGIQDYFTQVGDSINILISDMQTLVDNLNAYITFSTYYIYGSGVALLILLSMGIVMLVNQGEIKKQNEYIMEMIESRTLKGGERKDE